MMFVLLQFGQPNKSLHRTADSVCGEFGAFSSAVCESCVKRLRSHAVERVSARDADEFNYGSMAAQHPCFTGG